MKSLNNIPTRYLFTILFGTIIVGIFAFQQNYIPSQNGTTCSESAAITIFPPVNAASAGPTPTPNPMITSFTASNYAPQKGETVTLTWTTTGAERVSVGSIDRSFPPNGSTQIVAEKPQTIFLLAFNKNCYRWRAIFVDAIEENNYPWTQSAVLAGGVIAAEAAGTVIAAVAAPQNITLWNVWFALGAFLDRLRKKKPWGVVYSAVTKKPVSRAIIRLYRSSDNVLVETTVTDAHGIFRLNPKQGSYYMKAIRNNYDFPTKLVEGQVDGQYAHVYHGEVFAVDYDFQALMFAVPMDDKELPYWRKAFRGFMTTMEAVFQWVSDILLLVGFASSIAFVIRYQNGVTIGILAVYVVILSIKVAFAFMEPKQYGIVRDQKGRPIANMEVGIYETEFNTLVARTFTDAKGQYNFIVPFQNYNLRILDARYSLTGKDATPAGLPIKLPKNDNGENILFVIQDVKVTS